jgi:hypothetical protein
MKTENYKKPTLKEKVAQYENFLHKINMFIVSCNNEGIAELVKNADSWSYAHRCGEFVSDKQRDKMINGTFWKLCDTPEAEEITKQRQKAYTENLKKEGKQKLF